MLEYFHCGKTTLKIYVGCLSKNIYSKEYDKTFLFCCSMKISKVCCIVGKWPFIRNLHYDRSRIEREARKGADGYRSYEFLYEQPGGSGGKSGG